MLKLINIKRNEPFIEANYIPEASEEIGYIKIDVQSRKITESVLTSYDKTLKMYQGHARSTLLKLADIDNLPERYSVAWY